MRGCIGASVLDGKGICHGRSIKAQKRGNRRCPGVAKRTPSWKNREEATRGISMKRDGKRTNAMKREGDGGSSGGQSTNKKSSARNGVEGRRGGSKPRTIVRCREGKKMGYKNEERREND